MTDEYKSLAIGPNENPEYRKFFGSMQHVRLPAVPNLPFQLWQNGKLVGIHRFFVSGQHGGTGRGTAWHLKIGVL